MQDQSLRRSAFEAPPSPLSDLSDGASKFARSWPCELFCRTVPSRVPDSGSRSDGLDRVRGQIWSFALLKTRGACNRCADQHHSAHASEPSRCNCCRGQAVHRPLRGKGLQLLFGAVQLLCLTGIRESLYSLLLESSPQFPKHWSSANRWHLIPSSLWTNFPM